MDPEDEPQEEHPDGEDPPGAEDFIDVAQPPIQRPEIEAALDQWGLLLPQPDAPPQAPLVAALPVRGLLVDLFNNLLNDQEFMGLLQARVEREPSYQEFLRRLRQDGLPDNAHALLQGGAGAGAGYPPEQPFEVDLLLALTSVLGLTVAKIGELFMRVGLYLIEAGGHALHRGGAGMILAQEGGEYSPASAVIVMAAILVWMTVQASRVAAAAAAIK